MVQYNHSNSIKYKYKNRIYVYINTLHYVLVYFICFDLFGGKMQHCVQHVLDRFHEIQSRMQINLIHAVMSLNVLDD